MKFLKPLLLTAILAVTFALPARAQYTVWGTNMASKINGGTNVVGLTTNSYTTQATVDAKFSEYVSIGFQYTYHIAPVGVTPTVIARFQRSVDFVNWENASPVVITASGATNTLLWTTNINMGAYRGLRLTTIENTNSAVLTNVTIYSAIKR